MENFDNFLNPYFSGYNSADCEDNCEDNCSESYKPTSPLPKNPVPAMAYVPFQQFSQPYSSQEGFKKGTIFPCLDKPFLGEGGCSI